MRRIIQLSLICLFLSGCVGKFNLVKRVYDFNSSVGDKWTNELVFLGLTIVPIYEIAIFTDALIVNSIEFWTGTNPVSVKVLDSDSRRVVMKHKSDDSIYLTAFKSYKPEMEMILEKTDTGVVAKSAEGAVICRSVTDTAGGISVFDSADQLVKYYSPEEVSAIK